jgi:hypothetical protein
MKRFVVLFAVLVPLSLFIAGCDGASSKGKSSTETKGQQEDMQRKMQESMKKMGKVVPPAQGEGTAGEPAKK